MRKAPQGQQRRIKTRYISEAEFQKFVRAIYAEFQERERVWIEGVGEGIGLALVASAAACTESNKPVEMFLQHVASKTIELLPSVCQLAQDMGIVWADMLAGTEPPKGMCPPTAEIRAH